MATTPHDVHLDGFDQPSGFDMTAFLAPALRRWKAVLATGLVFGIIGFAASYLIPTQYTATSVFLPPVAQQSNATAALASLGALSGLVGSPGGSRNSPDQYIALMESATVSDRIIQKFNLRKLWKSGFQVDARNRLLGSVGISVGKKDNLMRVAVTDTDPVLAAAMANQYVDELRTLTNGLAMTEAQLRRAFFEHLVEQTRDKLNAAQVALEAGGFNVAALNTQPNSAGETYARLRAEKTAADVKLQVLRASLTDTSAEVRQQQQAVAALASQLAKLEGQNAPAAKSGDYVSRYREFKYEETLFELFAREYESARVDESRDAGLIQIVDAATPPERKSGPKHTHYGEGAFVVGLLFAVAYFSIRQHRATRA